ncbi:helix-turn-helix domain-containing protein [Vibrio quintilis]|uniref:DNA-binding transcriptional activator MhpR n=1 Tax=Vibrio quintilis TaxID=1117707 RepID=A0A1M7YQU8_9VIBR|nr:helix-turn-helix domain-containing protein [Vibrio quintilis]SHO55011.1 DNA-binding transcriptional activator MhpR [Vibrio quintilis]
MRKNDQSISSYNLKPTRFTLDILELLVNQGIEGMNLKDIAEYFSLPRSTVHRYLTTLTESGWVESSGSVKAKIWKPSNHFIKLAFSYRNAVREQIETVKAEYKDLTGEDLQDV